MQSIYHFTFFVTVANYNNPICYSLMENGTAGKGAVKISSALLDFKQKNAKVIEVCLKSNTQIENLKFSKDFFKRIFKLLTAIISRRHGSIIIITVD